MLHSLRFLLPLMSFCAALLIQHPSGASVHPKAVLPLMKVPPVIDGYISKGEWETLHISSFLTEQGDMLQARRGEFRVGSDGRKLYIAVSSAVHPKYGIISRVPWSEGTPDAPGVFDDDSIEIYIEPDPDSSCGKIYCIAVNGRGAAIDWVLDRGTGARNYDYRAKSLLKSHRMSMDGSWNMEASIDLADAGIVDPSKPIEFGLRRNYKLPSDRSTWGMDATGLPAARIRFAGFAPIVREVSVEDNAGINVGIEVTNPTSAAMTVDVKLGYIGSDPKPLTETAQAELKPGEKKLFSRKRSFPSVQNSTVSASAVVSGPDGETFYERSYQWKTRAVPAWTELSVRELSTFSVEYLPAEEMLRCFIDVGRLSVKWRIPPVRIRVIDLKTGKEVAERSPGDDVPGEFEEEIRLPDLPEGRYEARLFVERSGEAPELIGTAVFERRNLHQ